MSSTSSPSGANKKKSMKDLQEEITNLYNNIRLFEKGTKFFSGKYCLYKADVPANLDLTCQSTRAWQLIRVKLL